MNHSPAWRTRASPPRNIGFPVSVLNRDPVQQHRQPHPDAIVGLRLTGHKETDSGEERDQHRGSGVANPGLVLLGLARKRRDYPRLPARPRVLDKVRGVVRPVQNLEFNDDLGKHLDSSKRHSR